MATHALRKSLPVYYEKSEQTFHKNYLVNLALGQPHWAVEGSDRHLLNAEFDSLLLSFLMLLVCQEQSQPDDR